MRLQMSAGSHIRFKKNFTKPDTECRHNFRFDIPAFPCEAFALRCKVGCHRSTSKKKTFRSFPYTTLIMDSSPPIALVHCETKRALSPSFFSGTHLQSCSNTLCTNLVEHLLWLFLLNFYQFNQHSQNCFILEPHFDSRLGRSIPLHLPGLIPVKKKLVKLTWYYFCKSTINTITSALVLP